MACAGAPNNTINSDTICSPAVHPSRCKDKHIAVQVGNSQFVITKRGSPRMVHQGRLTRSGHPGVGRQIKNARMHSQPVIQCHAAADSATSPNGSTTFRRRDAPLSIANADRAIRRNREYPAVTCNRCRKIVIRLAFNAGLCRPFLSAALPVAGCHPHDPHSTDNRSGRFDDNTQPCPGKGRYRHLLPARVHRSAHPQDAFRARCSGQHAAAAKIAHRPPTAMPLQEFGRDDAICSACRHRFFSSHPLGGRALAEFSTCKDARPADAVWVPARLIRFQAGNGSGIVTILDPVRRLIRANGCQPPSTSDRLSCNAPISLPAGAFITASNCAAC